MDFFRKFDASEIASWINLLSHREVEGYGTDIRIIGHSGKHRWVRSGRYDDYSKLADDVEFYDGKAHIYSSLNPVQIKSDKFQHRLNELVRHEKGKNGKPATDECVDHYSWLLLDFDPKRSQNLSSLDVELWEARRLATTVLENEFIPHGIIGLGGYSGNGIHALIPITGETSEQNVRMLSDILSHLAEKYENDKGDLDTTVYNPSRLVRLYGTVNCKGKDEKDRPHRRSILRLPAGFSETKVLGIADLHHLLVPLKAKISVPTTTVSSGTADKLSVSQVEDFMTRNNLQKHSFEDEGKGQTWHLQSCPFNSDHGAKDSAIFMSQDGKMGFKCFHNSCQQNDWQSLKNLLNDTPYPAQKPDMGRKLQQKTVMETMVEEINRLARSPATASVKNEIVEYLNQDPVVAMASKFSNADFNKLQHLLNSKYSVAKTDMARWKSIVKSERKVERADQDNLGQKPEITINDRQLMPILNDLNQVVEKNNQVDPQIFQRASYPSWIRKDENDTPIAEKLETASARLVLSRQADFFKVSEDQNGDEKRVSALLPTDIVSAWIAENSDNRLPALRGIVNFPIMSRDGSFSGVGYHAESGYFVADDTEIEEIDAVEAWDFIFDEVLADFPFSDISSQTNAIALMLTPIVLTMIEGNAPIFALDANSAGTGKSLLAHACTLPTAPTGAKLLSLPERDEELRKSITSLLMSGASHIQLDNIARVLKADSLNAVLTAPIWSDRILGGNQMVDIPNKSTWICTGNNIKLSDEVGRRAVWIRLDAEQEQPWKRSGFKHTNLTQFLKDNRPKYLSSLYSIIRPWMLDGMPNGSYQLGSFEQWSLKMSGIFDYYSLDDFSFMGNADNLYDKLDSKRSDYINFFRAWFQRYGDNPVGIKDVFHIATYRDDGSGEGIIDHHLGNGGERSRKNNLGKELLKYEDRIMGGLKLLKTGTVARANQFRVIEVDTA